MNASRASVGSAEKAKGKFISYFIVTMSRLIKRLLQRIANLCGYQIVRREETEIERLLHFLKAHKISLVLDVGANIGQYAEKLLNAGYSGKIVSFEPLSEVHEILLIKSRQYKRWDVAPKCALGIYDGKVTIHVAGNLESSSLLPMLATHEESAPQSKYVGEEVVSIRRLDEVAGPYVKGHQNVFLKIDVQGMEDLVIEGATGIMDQIVGIQLEASLTHLYEGEKLWDEKHRKVTALGFEIYCIIPGYEHESTRRQLQVDLVYFRKPQVAE